MREHPSVHALQAKVSPSFIGLYTSPPGSPMVWLSFASKIRGEQKGKGLFVFGSVEIRHLGDLKASSYSLDQKLKAIGFDFSSKLGSLT